jgi:hypothetical protein
MDELSSWWSNNHAPFTKFLHLDVSSVMVPCVASNSSRTIPSGFEAKHVKTSLGGFEAQPPKLCRYRTPYVSLTSWTRVPPVLNCVSNMICTDMSSRACWCFQVSTITAGHSASPVAQLRPSTRASPLLVYRHESIWPSQLVTWLLQSINQDLALVLHCSFFIGMNSYDLYLHRRPLPSDSTPAHHKTIDMLHTYSCPG